jgi:hypothetical protein
MAVIEGYGTGYKNPTSPHAIAGVLRAAEVRRINSVIQITTGDSANSIHRVGSAPSDAIIDPRSRYYHEATGLTDFDVGIYHPNGGAVISADCLVNGDDVSAAGDESVLKSVATANLNKRLWEIAGLSSNPGGELDIVATQKAGTADTKVIVFKIDYSKTL